MWHKFTFNAEQMKRGAPDKFVESFRALRGTTNLASDVLLFIDFSDMAMSRTFLLFNGEECCADFIDAHAGKPSPAPAPDSVRSVDKDSDALRLAGLV